MTLSDISIKNPVMAWMLMVGLMVFGWLGFSQMGISALPDVDFPVISVRVNWEGAAPEVMETEVTDTIEDAVIQVQGVKEITSSSRLGNANISIEFELSRDIDVALQEVQTKIAQAQRDLPKDIDPPIVTKTNPEDQPIMFLAVSGDRPLKEIIEYTKDHLKDRFTTISGVGDIFLGGYMEPNLRVWLDADKMQKRELTVQDVMAAIRGEHAEVPAGYMDTGAKELNVRVYGEASSVQEFKSIIIPSRSGSPIWKRFKIGDVGTVEDGLEDIRRLSRVNGKTAVGLGIRKQRGSNAVEVAKRVRQRVADIQKTLPPGLTLSVNFDSTKFIEDSTHELVFTLLLSALLTSLICWLFLGSWTSAINIILAIPTSVMGTFIFLNFFGFTLNTFTLLGLTLVIGIVVDDAIMVLENIVRHRELGEPKVHAALVGAREITFAAMAASIAILAIFVPVIFMKGIVGKYFFQYGITISVAVLLSLLEALTLAPMRCSQFLEVGHTTWIGIGMDKLMRWLTRRYRVILDGCLNHRVPVIAFASLIFALSLFLMKTLKKEFVPSQDQSILIIRIQTPIGSSIEFTDGVFKQIETYMSQRAEVTRYFGAVGGMGGGGVNTGVMFITLKPPQERPLVPGTRRRITQQQFMAVLRKDLNKVPGIERAVVQDLSLSGFTASRGFPVEFTLRGSDWDQLAALGEEMRKKMADTDLMVDIDTDYLLGMPEVKVLPDRAKAAERAVSISDIGESINAMVGGVRVGKYTRGGRRYDIRMRLMEKDRQRPQDINKIWVRNNRGEVIRLSEVVTIDEKPTLLSITRKNRERAISIFANVAPGKSQGEALKTVEQLGKEILPEGVHLVFSGSAQTFQESFKSLLFALVLGIFVAYMVLASQFNSFTHPFTVLLALPFSITGAFIALTLGHQSINLYSMIGIILLMGIVKKNSILIVDFTNERRKGGMKLRDALMEACPIRLRPILMTSFSTIAAAIPPALALGPGAETRIPMALVIIGGVFVSTLLTLLVVPCAYSLLARFESHKHDADLRAALIELGELPKEN
ncbi:MAG: efflux RND transporter permease subunit [Elusimicrobia bacterium]|nr:efflux RND transporter permease subunit [Candidatus Obscuribacterium magneticum]